MGVSPSLTLPARSRDVTIAYTALSSVSLQTLNFRYKLVGSDKDWQEVGTRRQAFFMNLPPGHSQFQVQVQNNEIWNPVPANLLLTIPPTVTQTTWFRTLLILAILLIVSVIIALRFHRATEVVRLRMSERLAERERIARDLHDTLLQGFQSIVLKSHFAAQALPAEGKQREMLISVFDSADKVLLEGRNRVKHIREEAHVELSEALANVGSDLCWNRDINSL